MATTFRFGSASGPCRTATSERAEETEDKGNYDPDKLVQCPYDKNHQIRVCRFPYHILKCRKNHPKLASELKSCPFNARHLIHKHLLQHHIQTCEDRISLDPRDAGEPNEHHQWQVPISTWVNPNTTEDWDQEADEYAVPFVFGANSNLNPTLETKPTNNLGPNIRAPKSFPWSGYKP